MEEGRYDTWERVIPNLQIGDVLLIRNNRAVSAVISDFTQSYWSHTGMVFDIMHPDSENRIVLIIEALDNGIEIHRLRTYMDELGPRRIGFKRFPGLTEEQKQRIRGFFLNEVDTPYDFRGIFGYFVSVLFKRAFGVDILDLLARKTLTIENFVCSTFVQRAFYLAMPPGKRDRALFRSGSRVGLLQQLDVCSPGDIANSTNTEWLWNPHH